MAWFAGTAAVALVLGLGTTIVSVWRLQGNIHAVDVSGGLGTDRPQGLEADADGHRPLNVLVLGSDSRQGANGFVGGAALDEGRSDTTVVLHLAANRAWAIAVSIPRDSMVDMPSCQDREGGTSPPAQRQFNEAYQIGGVACTQRTVEQLTGLRIDHYVVVDFAGFKGMVDALGSVPICLPKEVNDTKHNIHLPAGRSRVNGEQALAYVRERYALGDGGDLGRIDRQQAFLSSVLQEATSAGTLTNPPKLYAFLQAATRSVTMDPALAEIGPLSSLARQVSAVGLSEIQMLTVPNEPYVADPNRLQWAPSAARLWRALRQDTPVTLSEGGTTQTPSATAIDPESVRIRVLNASGAPGAAAAAAKDLRDAGWNVVGVGDADDSGQQLTRIVHGSGPTALARAQALAAVIPGAELVLSPGLGATLQVEVGTGWPGVRPAASGSESPGATSAPTASGSPDPVLIAGARGRTANADICAV